MKFPQHDSWRIVAYAHMQDECLGVSDSVSVRYYQECDEPLCHHYLQHGGWTPIDSIIYKRAVILGKYEFIDFIERYIHSTLTSEN